jgi:hypothetical protein
VSFLREKIILFAVSSAICGWNLKNWKKYLFIWNLLQVTVAEVQRRLSIPECLNVS